MSRKRVRILIIESPSRDEWEAIAHDSRAVMDETERVDERWGEAVVQGVLLGPWTDANRRRSKTCWRGIDIGENPSRGEGS